MEPAQVHQNPSDSLVALAQAFSVATDYWDWQGRHAPISTETIIATLGALGVAASTPSQVTESLRTAADAPWRRTLPATVVSREGWAPRVLVHVPEGTGVRLTVDLEDGREWDVRQVDHFVESRWVDGTLVGEAAFEVPWNLPLGWHRLVAHVEAAPMDAESTTSTLVVTPQRLSLPDGLSQRRATGLMTQLYQVRSRGSWGLGDLRDLADLGVWVADTQGADFVLVNPLHSAQPVSPVEPSPYLPATRRFLSAMYLRVDDIPETARLSPADYQRLSTIAEKGRALNDVDGVDRDGGWAIKREALGLVHAVGLTGARAREYARFREQEGEGLRSYATWCALAEVRGLPSQDWPAALLDPRSPEVEQFVAEHADLVDLHCWAQWCVADQVRAAQRALHDAGMRVGIVEDLAVGVNPDGSDAWALSDSLAIGVSVGAPPDQFNQLGQTWGQPPWRPDRLALQGYRPFRDMVRTALRDSGGVRVDHVIGLFRLWWIPEGMRPDQGTYVRYDHEALVGILALEAHRAGAVVIGEDLGVVEPSARDYLSERGVLGTSILWFEWDGQTPRPPEHYRGLCLASVTTHDLPPTAGYLSLEHVAVRERLGLLTRTPAEEEAAELESIDRMRDALEDRGLIGSGTTEDVMVGLHQWLAQTPSRLLAVSLADVVQDRRGVNQPGTMDEYPNWRVPLSDNTGRILSLEDVTSGQFDDFAGKMFGALRGE